MTTESQAQHRLTNVMAVGVIFSMLSLSGLGLGLIWTLQVRPADVFEAVQELRVESQAARKAMSLQLDDILNRVEALEGKH